MMRDYTVVGYYTTKIGLESLGYPGLRDGVAEACPVVRILTIPSTLTFASQQPSILLQTSNT